MVADQVVDVIAVRHGFVRVSGRVPMGRVMTTARVLRRAAGRIGNAHRELVLVDVVVVEGVEVTVV